MNLVFFSPGLVNSWRCLPVDCSRRSSVSLLGVALFLFAEGSLQRETVFPVSAKSTPPYAHVFNVDGFSWVIDEPVRDILGRVVLVTEVDVFLGDMGVQSRSDGRVHIAHVADDEEVSWH